MFPARSSMTLVALFLTGPAMAQAPAWRFQWQPNQVLTYRADQVTTVAEVAEGKKTETTSKLTTVKRWNTQSVDEQGTATLQLSLVSLRMEMTRPSGEVLLFDSGHPDQSDPQLKEQLGKFIGQPLGSVRMTAKGKVLAVKDFQTKSALAFEAEPPFVVVFPAEEGFQSSWERAYKITLEPPQGTGEQYDAVQKYVCTAVAGGKATLSLATILKATPENATEQLPLLQKQPEGEIVFDYQAGALHSARLQIDKEVKNQQGEGSSYHFQSRYTEQLLSGTEAGPAR